MCSGTDFLHQKVEFIDEPLNCPNSQIWFRSLKHGELYHPCIAVLTCRLSPSSRACSTVAVAFLSRLGVLAHAQPSGGPPRHQERQRVAQFISGPMGE